VIVPVAARNVIAWVKGVLTESLWLPSQMQKTYVPAASQVAAVGKLNAPLTFVP
jgi:hypothetical protein